MPGIGSGPREKRWERSQGRSGGEGSDFCPPPLSACGGPTLCASGWVSPVGKGWCRDWTAQGGRQACGRWGPGRSGAVQAWPLRVKDSDSWGPGGVFVLRGAHVCSWCGQVSVCAWSWACACELAPAVLWCAQLAGVCVSLWAHTCAHSCEDRSTWLPSDCPTWAQLGPQSLSWQMPDLNIWPQLLLRQGVLESPSKLEGPSPPPQCTSVWQWPAT